MARTTTSWLQDDRLPTAWIGVSPEQYEINCEEARASGANLEGTKVPVTNTTWVIGADEVGRGCLAGPVTVCAVLAPEELAGMNVKDSKKLSAGQRIAINATLRAYTGIRFAIASRPSEDIDKYGIAECLRQCFAEVVQKMLDSSHGQKVRVQIDGETIKGFPLEAEYIIKGDSKVWAIGAASIIAKVWRDAYMADEARGYPGYGWEENAGYGTAAHFEAIKRLGLCSMHRTTFCKGFRKKEEDLISGMFAESP